MGGIFWTLIEDDLLTSGRQNCACLKKSMQILFFWRNPCKYYFFGEILANMTFYKINLIQPTFIFEAFANFLM